MLALPWSARGGEEGLFHKPVRLQADGKAIDTGEAWGHSGPTLADVDGDGLRDLVVGDFSGKFRVYRNIGSRSEPRYAPETYLMAGGVEAKVPIYCCIGSSPHFVDFDGDGQLDLISGSYDPGECYLFRGKGKGIYAARETIVDRSGRPVLRNPGQKQNFESFGSWPVMVDWDADGDLDLVVGAFDGTVFVRLNEGARREPLYATANIFVQVDGKDLKVPGDGVGHAAPAIADWDQDGRWDLLCGSERGSVYFYRNIGEAAAPRFEAGREIVPPHEGTGYNELLDVDAEPGLGIRSQIAALDYDEDGRIDLLVGDFCTNVTPRRDLTSDERSRMFAILKQLKETHAEIRGIMRKLQDEFARRYPGDAIYSDEATGEWSKAYKALREGKEFAAHEAKGKELNSELSKFLEKPAKPSPLGDDAASHGYVWLYRRK